VLRALEPRDRLVELVLLHQVHADVVVRVTEVRIDGDRAVTFLDRLVEAALEAHGPAEERVRFGRRQHGERAAVRLDRGVEIATRLQAIPFTPQRESAL
jgi:hypothetical protein